MITIKAIQNQAIIDNEPIVFFSPERELTPEEQKTITSIKSRDGEFIYYQGDEIGNKMTSIIDKNNTNKKAASFFYRLKLFVFKILKINSK